MYASHFCLFCSVLSHTLYCFSLFSSSSSSSSFFSDSILFTYLKRSYLSVRNFVMEYDLRQLNSPIVKHPTRDLSPILQNQDEVNQVALTYHTTKKPSLPKGKKKGNKKNKNNNRALGESKLYLAASDDAGTVRFMDAASTTTSQLLKHNDNAIVPACAFRPVSNTKGNLELASGGTDCRICLWDVLKPK